VAAKRVTLAQRRDERRKSKKPRTRPVPHPFLLPTITIDSK